MRKNELCGECVSMLVVNFVCVWKRSVFPERVLILTRRECCQHGLSVSFLVESAVILALGNGIFVDVIGPSTVCQVKPFQRVLNLKVAICNPPSK
jgi:hypothetical protein